MWYIRYHIIILGKARIRIIFHFQDHSVSTILKTEQIFFKSWYIKKYFLSYLLKKIKDSSSLEIEKIHFIYWSLSAYVIKVLSWGGRLSAGKDKLVGRQWFITCNYVHK